MKIRHIYVTFTWFETNFVAITLYPFIFLRKILLKDPERLEEIIRHEEDGHVVQIRKRMDEYWWCFRWMGWIHFYFSYLNESRKEGYHDNRYEEDARDKEDV